MNSHSLYLSSRKCFSVGGLHGGKFSSCSLALTDVAYPFDSCLCFTDPNEHAASGSSVCIPGGLPENKKELSKLYDGVDTFLMFIGYPRSSHSLVGSLLDAHPQIIISNEYHIIEKWHIYRDDALKNSGMQKYLLFYNLHSMSTWQATFGSRAKDPAFIDDLINSYNVPGAWQGSFNGKIKVSQ